MSNFLKTFRLSDQFKIPISISIIFLLLCISPVLPTIGLYLNGGLLGVVDRFLFDKNNSRNSNIFLTNCIVNLVLSIYFFVLFSVTKKSWVQVVFSALSIIFLYYFIAFILLDKFESGSETFLFFIPGLLSCLAFNIAVILKFTFTSRS